VDIRIPEELRAKIPQLGEAPKLKEPMVWVKLTCEEAGWTWYIIEMQELATDAIFYVYAVGWDEQLAYINRSDLELLSAEWGFPIVLDSAFVACELWQVKAAERGRTFPLGRLVATPGAIDALAAAGENPTPYLRRHQRGDWGDIDQHDVEENEYSLVHNFRLLSRYTLNGGTVIWIITEADRSATTILLPSEY
jgi:hypothetical protein